LKSDKKYQGINNDLYGGMTHTGSIIKDAWLFDLLSEEETCEGWTAGQIQTLYEQVYAAWEPYGHMVNCLPDELKQRHQQIHEAAVKRARELGWDPDLSNEM